MRYVIRQNWLSWGDDYTIKDSGGNDVFVVDGRVFSIGDKLSICDMQGIGRAFISQRLLAWGPTYDIYVDGERHATVSKRLFTLFRCKFDVDVPGPGDLLAEGDFFEHEYSFYRHGEVVASVSKRWFSWTDTYGVDTSEAENDLIILASAVVIDQICHDSKKQH